MNGSVVFDMDGVLADFEKAFCEKFGNERRWLYSLEKRYPWREYEIGIFTMSSMTYELLDIIETGVRMVRWCESAGLDIHIVSSRPSYTQQVTGLWLKRNKIPFHYLDVFPGNKLNRICRIAPLFVVDDMVSVCMDCAEVGIPAFLIDQPWNRINNLDGLIYRVESFEDFTEKLDKFVEIY